MALWNVGGDRREASVSGRLADAVASTIDLVVREHESERCPQRLAALASNRGFAF